MSLTFEKVKNALIFLTAIIAIGFNLFFKIDINAQSEDSVINAENLLKEHNKIRDQNSLPEFTLNNKLTISAIEKAKEMIVTDCWSHFCPVDKSPWDFFTESGYEYIFAGENLGEGYFKIPDLMNAWLASKSHKENILRKEYTDIGFGVLTGRYQGNDNNILVVVHFGAAQKQNDITTFVKITKPLENNTLEGNVPLEVAGFSNSKEELIVQLNDKFIKNVTVKDNAFNFDITEGFSSGTNTIIVHTKSGITDKVSFQYSLSAEEGNSASTNVDISNSEEQKFMVSPDAKNLVNFVILIFLVLLLVIDILIMSRTNAINSFKSLSSLHISIILILAIVTVIGGIAGTIGSSAVAR